MNRQLRFWVGALVLLSANTASAHLSISSHDSRGGDQKVGPCEGARRGSQVYTYEPGETITVSWTEDIPHPGWFRIAFDADGEDDFEPPATVEPKDLFTNDAVLADDLFPHDSAGFGERRSTEVTLPDVECDNCTMQIIQIMLDKPPYDPSVFSPLSGDIYYRCVDMELKRSETTMPDPSPDPDPDPGSTDTGTSTDAGMMMSGDDGTAPPMGNNQMPPPADPANAGNPTPPPAMPPPAGPSTSAPPPANMLPTTGSMQQPVMTPSAQPTTTTMAGQGGALAPPTAAAPPTTTTEDDSGCTISRPAASTSATALGAVMVCATVLGLRRKRRMT